MAYVLPDLEYDYAALEPPSRGASWSFTTRSTMPPTSRRRTPRLDEAREVGDFTQVAGVEEALSFNLSGHVLLDLLKEPDIEERHRAAREVNLFVPAAVTEG